MNDQKTINFALLGCGRIAERHAEQIAKFGKLVSVCDVKKDRVDRFAEKYSAKAYYSVEDMLKGEEVRDVVSVCTPNGLHAEHTILALRSGSHVLCEKPMALSVRDCEKMIMESEKAGRKLFIVKQNRFNPPVVELKRIIDEGKLGEIFSIGVNCFWNRNESYYKESDWKGTKDMDGGVLFTQFSHFIDPLYWMFGNIEEVKSFITNSNHNYTEIDDQGVVIVKFSNGILGTINYTTNSFEKNLEGSITVFGQKGTIKIGGPRLNCIEYVNIKDYSLPELPKGNEQNQYGTYEGSAANHDSVYENLVNVLNNNGEISTSGIEGMKTVETICKIYKEANK